MKLEDLVEDAAYINALKRDRFVILEEDEIGIMLKDKKSNLVLIRQDNPYIAEHWLQNHFENCGGYPIFMSDSDAVKIAINNLYPNKSSSKCFQYVYDDPKPVSFSSNLTFKKATLDNLDLFDDYKLADTQEIIESIRNGEIIIAMKGNPIVGVAGMHPEGSMGLLEIFEPYRRNGYAFELEKAVINLALSNKDIPYCDVFQENTPSICLQEKSGLKKSKRIIRWYFDKEEGESDEK